ncbi:unnamed protein product [Dovyalis caffra]|uniref:Uncharacterized protein n=1 Tax=Dovyalis caffra TaxID=77055 RepID=A0AAV1SHJ0_9ROSI|nr:unnamed protein product [Dovyalis caffra]
MIHGSRLHQVLRILALRIGVDDHEGACKRLDTESSSKGLWMESMVLVLSFPRSIQPYNTSDRERRNWRNNQNSSTKIKDDNKPRIAVG